MRELYSIDKILIYFIFLTVLLSISDCGCRNFENNVARVDYDLVANIKKETLFLDDGDYTDITLDINSKSEVAEICDFKIIEWSINNDVKGEFVSDSLNTIDIKELTFKKGSHKLKYKPSTIGEHIITLKVIDEWQDLEKEIKFPKITVKQKKDFSFSISVCSTYAYEKAGVRYYPIDVKIGEMDKDLDKSAFKVSNWKFSDGIDMKFYDKDGNEILYFGLGSDNNRIFYIKAPNNLSGVPPTITATISCDDRITKDGSISLDEVYKAMKIQKKIEKDLFIDRIRKNGIGLSTASDELRKDREVVLAAVSSIGSNLQYASNELQDDREIVLAAVIQHGNALQYASERLRKDKEIVWKAIQGSSRWLASPLKYASDELKDNQEFVLKAIGENSESLCEASERLRNDKEIVKKAITQHGASFVCASESLKNDKEFALKFVKQNGNAFKYVSSALQSDKEVVLEAVKKNKSFFDYTSKNFKSDKELMLEMDKNLTGSWVYASEELQDDVNFVLKALRENKDSSQYIRDSKINSKRKIIVPILQQNGKDLKYVRPEFQSMKKVVMEAIKQSGGAFKYASEDLKNDKKFVLEAVREAGVALEYASDELRNDKEIVLQALKNDTSCLKYASEKLRGDTKFISFIYQTLDINKRSKFLTHYKDFNLVFPELIKYQLQKTVLSLEELTAPVINLDLECPVYDFNDFNLRFYVKEVKISAKTLSGLNIKFVSDTSETIGDVARKTVIELRKASKLTEEVKQYLEEFPFIYLAFKEKSFSQKDEERKLRELL